MGRLVGRRPEVPEEHYTPIFKVEGLEKTPEEAGGKLRSSAGLLLDLLLVSEDGADIFLRNVGLSPN
jgi:hypothetical protein